MEFLPKMLGTRPRLACEIRAEGVVAARAEDASALLAAISAAALPEGVSIPQLRAGHTMDGSHYQAADTLPQISSITLEDRAALVQAVRKTLEAVALRSRDVTLIVPDSAARVLLLDFDDLPGKPAEALPIVRFRLKKLLPFDADDAVLSYQVMSSGKAGVRVVAVAMPRQVLAAYESIAREAGFEPGAVLPSTLAVLAGLPAEDAPALILNAGEQGLTTAIVQGGVLLLHRTIDLRTALEPDPVALDAQRSAVEAMLPLVNRDASAQEWAMQEPTPYSAPASASNPITALLEQEITREIATEIAEDLEAERSLTLATSEIAQTISRAAAYFEDTLQLPPRIILTTGTMSIATLAAILAQAEVGPLTLQEIVSPEMLGPGATSVSSGRVPPGWLAGVRGALAD